MRKFIVTISDDALETLRKRLEYELSDEEVIRDLFYIDDRGENDVDVRSEVSVMAV